MLRLSLLALLFGAMAPAATAQYYDLSQRTRIVVQLPNRPVKAHFSDRLAYRAALKKYHSEVRRKLRAERAKFRRLYLQRRRPVIVHRTSN